MAGGGTWGHVGRRGRRGRDGDAPGEIAGLRGYAALPLEERASSWNCSRWKLDTSDQAAVRVVPRRD